ncbi:MAG: RHS repeat protein [Brachymonas sp.]|nr:RHS repeat protein [Brachymonas sp.]
MSAYSLPQGGEEHYAYDLRGRLVQTRTPECNIHYEWDANGNCTALKRSDGQHQRWAYNAEDRLIAHSTDARTVRWEYEGDAITQRIQADGSQFYYHYDSENNLTGLTNERGENYQLRYDENERLIEEIGFDGRRQTYQYNTQGHLACWQDPMRQARYQRNALGQVTHVQYR